MSQENYQPEFESRYSESLLSIISTIRWVVIALILAFVFRAFIMEAFRIPTGSMAETLRGAHYHLRCSQCGFTYDLGADNSGSGGPRCYNCGYEIETPLITPPSNGDRILVLKCLYEFQDPRRWDVAVFKYPIDPDTNFIKRIIGLPGESVDILDGDIYIDGQIARKPPKVQDELWMPIYNNDYLPNAAFGKASSHFDWIQPFANIVGSNWKLNRSGTTYFTLESPPDQLNTIIYDPALSDDFRPYYAYNHTTQYKIINNFCTDLKVRYYTHNLGSHGQVGAQIKKYDTLYKGIVSFDGTMRILKQTNGQTTELAVKKAYISTENASLFEFAIIDRQAILEFDGEKLRFDLGGSPGDLTVIEETPGSLAGIIGAGNIRLSHIALFRDIYYTDNVLRPRPGEPFKLGEDEYFTCGDNTPSSFDSRLWATEGRGNSGKTYRKGIVPRDFIMGKAFFVYWGDAFKPFDRGMPIIPNFAQMKLIHGGSKEEI